MAIKRVSENKVVMPTGAAAVPARRKSITPKRASRSAVEPSLTPEVVCVEPVIEVSSDAVARLAYSYWESRGYQGGSPEEDWLRAEQELRAATSK